jgi:hypothetical protein
LSTDRLFSANRLFHGEGDGVEDGLEAFAYGIEFRRGDVADSADVATTEGVDDEVEAVAGVVAVGGVDLVAGFGADGSVFVVAVGEGGSGDLRGGDGSGGLGGGLVAALRLRGSGGDAEVEECSGEGGGGVGVEGDGGDAAHLVDGGSGADVEGEGADLGVVAGEGPANGNLEGDTVALIFEGGGRWSGGVGHGGVGGTAEKRKMRLRHG